MTGRHVDEGPTGCRAAPYGPTALLVIAKEPVPGRVKTRLTPPFSPDEAAELAEAALADTLRAVAELPARRRTVVLDGRPGSWLPPGFDVVPQCAGGLDERLAAAFAASEGPTLLIGMDTPQVTRALLAPALGPDAWRDCGAWFGPAEDGGFWALGLAAPDPALLRGVPMSAPETGAVQRERLTRAGLTVRDLPPLRDVDTATDATHVAATAPHGAFAATYTRLVGDRMGRGTQAPGPADGDTARPGAEREDAEQRHAGGTSGVRRDSAGRVAGRGEAGSTDTADQGARPRDTANRDTPDPGCVARTLDPPPAEDRADRRRNNRRPGAGQ